MTMIDLYKNSDLLNEIMKEFAERKGSVIYETMSAEGPPPIPEKK